MWSAIADMVGGMFRTIRSGIRARREKRRLKAERKAAEAARWERMRAASRKLGEQRGRDMGEAMKRRTEAGHGTYGGE